MAQARSSLIFSEQVACVTSLCVCRGSIYGKRARSLHEVAGHDLPCLARGPAGHRSRLSWLADQRREGPRRRCVWLRQDRAEVASRAPPARASLGAMGRAGEHGSS